MVQIFQFLNLSFSLRITRPFSSPLIQSHCISSLYAHIHYMCITIYSVLGKVAIYRNNYIDYFSLWLCFFSVVSSSLPQSLKHIVSNAEYYGPSIYLPGTACSLAHYIWYLVLAYMVRVEWPMVYMFSGSDTRLWLVEVVSSSPIVVVSFFLRFSLGLCIWIYLLF